MDRFTTAKFELENNNLVKKNMFLAPANIHIFSKKQIPNIL